MTSLSARQTTLSAPRGREAAQLSAPQRESTGRLRVLFVTEEDPLYVIRFFEVFFADYPRDEFEICGVVIDRAFHEPMWKTLRRMLALYGPARVFRLGLRFVGARLRGQSIRALAQAEGAPLVPTSSVNRPDFIARVKAMAPDVIVSVAAPEIFRREILAAPRLGCVNIHCGRLPAYRGMLPSFWQMLRGETAAIITVHEMAEKLDAGGVLATQAFAIAPCDSLDRVITETKRQSARLLISVLRELKAGRARATPLDMTQAGYFSFPTRTDARAFRKRGHRFL